jgi:CRP-like cAMP-binding protein
MALLEPPDIEVFTRSLAFRGLSDPDEVRAGLAIMHVRTLARGEFLLRGGEPAVWLGMLVSGLMREYFVSPHGIERTKAFILPGETTGSLADLLSGKPSRAFIVAEAPCRLILGPYTGFRDLEARSPAWAKATRHGTEFLLMRKAEREYELLCLDAAERYAALTARYPGIENVVAARHIASYLGITPVHLSRLRARRVQAAMRAAQGHAPGGRDSTSPRARSGVTS